MYYIRLISEMVTHILDSLFNIQENESWSCTVCHTSCANITTSKEDSITT